MKKLLLSISSLIFTVAILAGGTRAFLSDRNKSTGNTFATGVIDLKVDNESYITNDWGALVYSTSTSWSLSKLAGKLFFNFLDIKPGDIGEDTISLHVKNNNAWACMNVKITATPENGQTEPENLLDSTESVNGGELQKYLYFAFWADDGDNVYEKGEKIFEKGLAKEIFNGKNWTIADSSLNIWSSYKNDPLIANSVKYIGKAWCFGSLSENPVNQDGKGKTGRNGPLVRGTGVSCNGKYISNIVQSDGLVADVSFFVEQSRNNSKFVCQNDNNSGSEYCSHGYWKQSQHFNNWKGYVPTTQFSSVFENAFPGKTLLEVLQLGGGGLNQLGRETVGALLNAGSLSFPYTQAQVISMFNAVYPGSSSSYESLVGKFALPENCPLN
jgi:predicted ribosomally synthesized peptide with SipW-like signal peptide